MSEHHRQTQRVRHHAARHTMRAPRFQVGGDTPAWYYHIDDTTRAVAWNAALNANPNLTRFAIVITTPGWERDSSGIITDAQRLKLYIEMIERQDEMFREALSIIYSKLDLDPTSDTLEDNIHSKINVIEKEEPTLKEYLKDVVKLIYGKSPDNNYGALFSYSLANQKEEKISRLLYDPLSQILLWPERVSNILIEYIARILIKLKEGKIRNIIMGDDKLHKLQIATFSNKCNAFIQSNALALTYTGIRDGFFIWHETANAVVPLNTCPATSCSFVVKPPNDSKAQDFWESFCRFLEAEDSDDVKTFNATNTANITIAQLTAYIYKLYLDNSIDIVKSKILQPTTFKLKTDRTGKPAVATTSNRRPPLTMSLKDIGTEEEKDRARLLCALDPSQYAFIFHLLYTIESIEEEEASKATGATPTI